MHPYVNAVNNGCLASEGTTEKISGVPGANETHNLHNAGQML